MKTNCCDPKTAAVALGRWGFGVMFLFYGIGKFLGLTGFVQYLVGQYQNTWLPAPLISIFGYVLPFIEVTLGVLLLLGLARNATLFAVAILMIVLTFGQVVLQQPPVVFYNMGYLFFALLLLFFHEHDRWVLGMRHGEKPAATGAQPM